MLWLIGFSLLSCFLVLFLLGRRDERAIRRDFELLLARRKALGEATDSWLTGGPWGANLTFRTAMLWMALLVVIFLAWHYAQIQRKETSKKFTEFVAMVEANEVADVFIAGNEIRGHTVGHEAFRSFGPPTGYDRLVDCLLARKVMVTYEADEARAWANMLAPWAPFVLLVALAIPFAWQTWTGPVIRERWRLKREGYTALLKGLAELRNHLDELVGPEPGKGSQATAVSQRPWAQADRVDALIRQLASELAVAELWLRADVIVGLRAVDLEMQAIVKGAAPHPDAGRQAVKTIDEALVLLAEGFREELRLERRGL